MKEFGQGVGILIINGRKISEFGESETPVRFASVNPKRQFKRGQGGTVLKLTRINPGRTLTVAVMPGSKDSAYLSGLWQSGDDIEAQWVVMGTDEKIVISEGIATDLDEISRGGMNPSDDVYTYDFNKFLPEMGD